MSDSRDDRASVKCFIGYAFAFTNDELKFDWFGSPHEILEQMRLAQISPNEAAQHMATKITVEETWKDGTQAMFHGGPYALAIMKLLDEIAAENWPEAAELLQANPQLLTAQHDAASVPLATAAASGNLEAVSFLLAHGADVDRGGDLGMTALHSSAVANEREVATALLAAGAIPSLQNWFLMTPAQLAYFNSHIELVQLLAKGKPSGVDRVAPMDILKAMGCSLQHS